MIKMENYLRPQRFEKDPNSPTAAKEWLHWYKTFKNFASALQNANKDLDLLSLLINHLSPKIYAYIAECTTYDTAIDSLQKLYSASTGSLTVEMDDMLHQTVGYQDAAGSHSTDHSTEFLIPFNLMEQTIEVLEAAETRKTENSGVHWDDIQGLADLEACGNLIEVPSRLAPKKSNKASEIQNRCVTGGEVLRRVAGPERMSVSLLGDYLKLGNSNASPDKIRKGQTRQSLKRLTSLCSAQVPPTKKKKYQSGPLYTQFSLLTEGDVKYLADGLVEQACGYINEIDIRKAIKDEIPGGDVEKKIKCIQITRKVMEAVLQQVEKEEQFDSVTHGGTHFLRSAWQVFSSMLPTRAELSDEASSSS